MTPDEQILALLAAWGPTIVQLLNQHGYFKLDPETVPEQILGKLGAGFKRQSKAESIRKNKLIWPIVRDSISDPAFKAGASVVARQLNIPLSTYPWDNLAQKFYDTHGDFFIKTMSQTDIIRLHADIQRFFHLHPAVFGKQFAEAYACSPSRLERIKRTEVHASAQGGGWQFANAAGVQFKQWLCTPRGPWPRPSHRAIWYEVASLDQPFSNGLYYPSDINCRCYIYYFMDRAHLDQNRKG